MAEQIFALGFLENIKVLFVAILIYAVIFALLNKIQVLGEDSRVNSLIALVSAIIVSFSGVVTYAISYAVNWFVIVFFVVFFLVIILMFLGVELDKITDQVTKRPIAITIIVIFGLLFLVILVNSFFVQDSSFGWGSEEVYDSEGNLVVEEKTKLVFNFDGIDKELLSVVIFLVILGVFVMFLGGRN